MSTTKTKKTKKVKDQEDVIDIFMFTDMPYPERQMTIYGLIQKDKIGGTKPRR
jgi:hypothetical protein